MSTTCSSGFNMSVSQRRSSPTLAITRGELYHRVQYVNTNITTNWNPTASVMEDVTISGTLRISGCYVYSNGKKIMNRYSNDKWGHWVLDAFFCPLHFIFISVSFKTILCIIYALKTSSSTLILDINICSRHLHLA